MEIFEIITKGGEKVGCGNEDMIPVYRIISVTSITRTKNKGEKMDHLEAKIQSEIVNAIRRLGVFVFSVPNDAAGSNAIRQGQAITMGLYPGVSDLIVLPPSGVAHFLEIKTLTGKLSPSQIKFQYRCTENGWPYAVARSVPEALHILATWGILDSIYLNDGAE